ncbi:PaaI family thioesterase [Candidatus Bipolaricaulota bacterium]|nr:PaaI family thioesterase [Candidatus Bipolaricaulota bacterium]
MGQRVMRKQPNSKMCLVCGMKNSLGLKAFFYELENGEVLAIFHPCEEHQSYPGRMHGGIATAILDETIGRAGMIKYGEDMWGVTLEFHTRFRKPVPLDAELRVLGRITGEKKRAFVGSGEILLPDGAVAVEGKGRFLKLPIDKIADFDVDEQEWKVVPSPEDPQEVNL